MAAEVVVDPDKLMSLKSNSFFALLDSVGHSCNEAPMGNPVLLTDVTIKVFYSKLRGSVRIIYHWI
jgi:hypothetical protein